jgi:hypothetical protein
MSNGPKPPGGPTAGAAPRRSALEPLALVLLSLATVGTAWCSYQAAVWGAVSQRTMNRSAAASRDAVLNEFQAYQLQTVDVLLFSQYVNARAASNDALAQFYSDRFRGEAKTAFEAWMATKPFENEKAPPHPFVTNLFQPRTMVDARESEAESQRLWDQAGNAGRNSRGYVLVTVLLASALFCGGTAPRFNAPWIRHSVVILGLVVFLCAAMRLLTLPVQL